MGKIGLVTVLYNSDEVLEGFSELFLHRIIKTIAFILLTIRQMRIQIS